MELLLRQSGKKRTSTLEVSDAVFAAPCNEPLVHQVVTAFMAGARAGSKAQKNRSAVRGGGRKPWRQKGTGRARAGTIRSPIWRGGGVTFAARPRNHSVKVNKKMRRAAMRSILSELARQQRLSCIDTLALKQPRTKAAAAMLAALGLADVLIIIDKIDTNLLLATRNLPAVELIEAGGLDPYRLLAYEQVLVTQAAVEKIQAQLA